MSKEKVLEDWSEYDDRKKRKGDANFFSCEESWEVDYLVDKIRKSYPNFSEQKIKEAISECCKTVSGNKPRRQFVECVMNRLL